MDTPNRPPATPNSRPLTLALAVAGLALVVGLTVFFQSQRPEYRVWNLSVIGALGLFAAARLGLGLGIAFTAVAIALKDVVYYRMTDWWEPYPLSWLYFACYALAGWYFLRRSTSAGRIAGTALGVSLGYFVISNFVAWLEQALPYGYSFEGLLNCYAAAIPFYRGTLLGDLIFTGAFFGLHAVLSVQPVAEEARDEGGW